MRDIRQRLAVCQQNEFLLLVRHRVVLVQGHAAQIAGFLVNHRLHGIRVHGDGAGGAQWGSSLHLRLLRSRRGGGVRLRAGVHLPVAPQNQHGQCCGNKQSFGIHCEISLFGLKPLQRRAACKSSVSRDRVISAAAPRVAAAQAFRSQARAFARAVFAQGFDGVLGTRRHIAAARREKRADGQLVKPNQR